MDATPAGHDIIVVGGSAGGLQALQRLVADLPADLPASVFVVLHLGATSHLADILDRVTALPVSQAVNGQSFARGQIYVAVPDRHLLLHNGHMLLRRGPRENLCRPALDPLFRSAAASYGGRVIGVVLSGALNDGAAGLDAIKCGGGLAVVQDPHDAAVRSMPDNALRHVAVDHVVPAAAMGALLARLAAEPAGTSAGLPVSVRLEAAIAAEELDGMKIQDELGEPSPFTCPECHGALWELADDSILRYRCHVGHAFTGEAMLSAHSSEVEALLWSLMRSHRERAALARRMAEEERKHNRDKAANVFQARSRDYEEDAELVRRLLVDRGDSAADAEQPTAAG